MARVQCTIPNASELINDIAFKLSKGVMISDEITDEQAANFAMIAGFSVVGGKKADEATPATPAAPKA